MDRFRHNAGVVCELESSCIVSAVAEASQVVQHVAVFDVVRLNAEIGKPEAVGPLDVISALSVDVRSRQAQRGGHGERYASTPDIPTTSSWPTRRMAPRTSRYPLIVPSTRPAIIIAGEK